MRLALLCALLAGAVAARAVDVGCFDNTRGLSATWNPHSGALMTMFSALWADRGAVWHETPALTNSFLATVSAFFTSEINTDEFTSDEQTAAVNWVQAGGTLIVTCDCPCDSNQVAYNTLLNQFGVNDLGAGNPEGSVVLSPHRVTSGITSVTLGVHGILTGPAGALNLMKDVEGHLVALVMQGTPEVGNGRLLVVADNDCFSDFLINSYEDDLVFAANIADWALRPYTISGKAIIDGAAGSVAGLPIKLQLFGQTGLLETFSGALDSSGGYSVSVDYPGPMDVLLKPYKWLAVRKKNVSVGTTGSLDVEFAYGGDADNSNAVNLLDISDVLRDFGQTGNKQGDVNLDGAVGLKDLSIVLKDYNKAGDN